MMETMATESIARGVLESLSDHKIVLSISGTDYQIHLIPTVPAAQIQTPVGKRIKGTISAKALRLFTATGGGTFIEPIQGEPRSIAGRILAIDRSNRRLLIAVVVPMWLSLLPEQKIDQFSKGDLVNCYVESGAQFTPSSGSRV